MSVRHIVYIVALALPSALYACSSEAPQGPAPVTPAKADAAAEQPAADSGASTTDAGRQGDGGGMHRDGGNTPDAGPACDGGACPPGAACTDNAQCETNLCFQGGQRSYCTKRCQPASAAADCPKPVYAESCNNQGYCKFP